MGSQEHNLAELGQIVKHIPGQLIEKLKIKHKIQKRAFSATSHAAAMIFAQLSHALSSDDICDCLRFHKGYLVQIRDQTRQKSRLSFLDGLRKRQDRDF